MKNLKERYTRFFLTSVSAMVLFPLSFYQNTLSPDHGIFTFFRTARCRFYPSCSAYMRDAVRQYGLFYGAVASSRRILRCGPWSAGGYDPISSIF